MIYAHDMTLSARNNFFKGGIVFAALSLGLAAAGGYFAYPVYSGFDSSAALRPWSVFLKAIENRVPPSAYVPFWTMLGAAAYSLVSIVLVHHFFEKTQSPEILFFGFFVISLSFEIARILIPLKDALKFPSVYVVSAARFLLFGRFFGLFSLFAASVYAAGLDGHKQQYLFFMSVLAALVIALNVPIDSLVWDSTFMLWNGYHFMFLMVETGILAVTVITYFVSAYTRGSRSYMYIGIGTFLAFTGKNILLASDTWITPVPGLALLVLGTWIVCARLHQQYLWL